MEKRVGQRMLSGERIKARRLALGITQAKAAELASMTQQEWNRLERAGEHAVELSTAVDVASALDLVVDELEATDALDVAAPTPDAAEEF